MTCRCDIEQNYGGVRRWCEACLQRIHDAGRIAAARQIAAATERIAGAPDPQAEADRRRGAAVREALGPRPDAAVLAEAAKQYGQMKPPMVYAEHIVGAIAAALRKEKAT